MQESGWPRIAVMGAGAVGCYFGGMLARAGAPTTLIGRAEHVQVINRQGLFVDSINFQELIPVAASTDVGAASEAELVLLCVKTTDTEEAARSLAPYLKDTAIVVSLQNGVDNVDRFRSAAGIEAIPAVVYVAAEMIGPGRVKHKGRGDLVIGAPSDRNGRGHPGQLKIDRIAKVFTSAGISCVASDNIQVELWKKLIINCAYNAVSALGKAKYGQIASNTLARGVMVEAIEEAVAVARAMGVDLRGENLIETSLGLAEKMIEAMSSTAQDIERGRRTEIDSLNGYVARRGADFGVTTPVNQTLYALVTLLEETNCKKSHS